MSEEYTAPSEVWDEDDEDEDAVDSLLLGGNAENEALDKEVCNLAFCCIHSSPLLSFPFFFLFSFFSRLKNVLLKERLKLAWGVLANYHCTWYGSLHASLSVLSLLWSVHIHAASSPWQLVPTSLIKIVVQLWNETLDHLVFSIFGCTPSIFAATAVYLRLPLPRLSLLPTPPPPPTDFPLTTFFPLFKHQ